MEQIKTRYAKNGDIHIAYQVFGEGDIDLVFVPGFISHLENDRDEPRCARWLQKLGRFARVIMFDKQGTGLSDHVSKTPTMDERMDDIQTVMDAVGVEKAAIFGISEGGCLATLFAASHPDRSQALILYGAYASDKDSDPTQEGTNFLLQYIETAWGSGESLPLIAPTMKNDLALKQWWGRWERLGANPGAARALILTNSEIDITNILPSINLPTLIMHRRDDTFVNAACGRLLAERIPNAKYVELPGSDHLYFVGEGADQILDETAQFLTGNLPSVEIDRILSTVLFTDIVGSTEHAIKLGDSKWRELLNQHHMLVRKELARFRGREMDTAGDGFFAAFDGPARAIHCALSISDNLQGLGIKIRAGLHTGECEMIGEKFGGIAVHIGARVMANSSANEILVSSTVKDLVAGSGIKFEERGAYKLKGIPDEMHLYAVVR